MVGFVRSTSSNCRASSSLSSRPFLSLCYLCSARLRLRLPSPPVPRLLVPPSALLGLVLDSLDTPNTCPAGSPSAFPVVTAIHLIVAVNACARLPSMSTMVYVCLVSWCFCCTSDLLTSTPQLFSPAVVVVAAETNWR